MPYISATDEIMYAPLDFRLIMSSYAPILRQWMIFFLVHGGIPLGQIAHQTRSSKRHRIAGGYLWTKMMPSVWWKILLRRAKTDKRAIRTPPNMQSVRT